MLTVGSGLLLEGRLEPSLQHKYIRTHKRPAPFEDHFYFVLMNLCLAFFLDVDFSISWIFIEVEKMFTLFQCHLAEFSEALWASAVRSP